MRKVLCLFAFILSVTSLQAVALTWTTTDSSWTSGTTSSTFYFVYSASSELSAADLVSYVSGASTSSSVVVASQTYSAGTGTYMDGATYYADFKGISPTANSSYFYLVFKTSTTDATYDTYTYSTGVQYTGNSTTDLANGIAVDTVSGNSLPATGAYYAVTYGGSVPEPTVLALLALGVAGLALKRRV